MTPDFFDAIVNSLLAGVMGISSLIIQGKAKIKLALASLVMSRPRRYWSGLHEYCLQGERHDLVKVLPKGLCYPIYLRRGTSDVQNYAQIFCNREYGFVERAVPPKTILDLGGYIGLASIFLANLFPDAQIFLVEPDPDNFAIALLNCRGYKNITCLNAGVWPKSCSLGLSRQVGGDWGNMYQEVQACSDGSFAGVIEAWSVPDLMNRCGFQSLDFLKIDIEGAEKALFDDSDSIEWLLRCKLVSCELHDRMVPGCSESVHSAVAKAGFSSFTHGEYSYFVKS